MRDKATKAMSFATCVLRPLTRALIMQSSPKAESANHLSRFTMVGACLP